MPVYQNTPKKTLTTGTDSLTLTPAIKPTTLTSTPVTAVAALDGNDTITVATTAKTVHNQVYLLDGGAGNDTLVFDTDADSSLGRTVVRAHTLNDTFSYGTDKFIAQTGAFAIESPSGVQTHVNGVETMKFVGAGAVTLDLSKADAGKTIYTTAKGDQIALGRGSNTVYAGSGDDEINVLSSTTSANKIYAQDGNDRVTGGSGNDTIDGGNGHDLLAGKQGNDVISGGAGDDTVVGGEGNDILSGGAGQDQLYGDAGQDTYNWTTNSWIDRFDGGTGRDTASFASATTGINVTSSGEILTAMVGREKATLGDVEQLIGTKFGDSITIENARLGTISSGDGGDNITFTASGKDTATDIYGGAGSDSFTLTFNGHRDGLAILRDFSASDVIRIQNDTNQATTGLPGNIGTAEIQTTISNTATFALKGAFSDNPAVADFFTLNENQTIGDLIKGLNALSTDQKTAIDNSIASQITSSAAMYDAPAQDGLAFLSIRDGSGKSFLLGVDVRSTTEGIFGQDGQLSVTDIDLIGVVSTTSTTPVAFDIV